MKALKNMGFGPRKSKSGFTLIELLIVMVILAILVGVVVMAVGGVFGTAKSAAYNSVRDELQNAVTAYATDHSGNLPYFNTTAGQTFTNANCSACYIINTSALLTTQGGMLRQTPAGSKPANCAGLTEDKCTDRNHYTWGVTATGGVFSKCENSSAPITSCTTNNSEYQGVWP